MSRQSFVTARGQVGGRELNQSYPTEHRMNSGAFLPTFTGNASGNYIGGTALRGTTSNIDINGLSQPTGSIGDPKNPVYRTNNTGMSPMYGGTLTTGLKSDLSKGVKYTSALNLTGFSDPRQLGILNQSIYNNRKVSSLSEQGRLSQARGKHTTLLEGIKTYR